MDAERDLREQVEALGRQIRKHPGHEEHRELGAFERSITAVFLPNLRELLELLERASNDPDLAIELIQNLREPVVRQAFHTDVTQRLHNYLASVASLVDHVRNLMRGREGAIAEEFERRKTILLANPEVPFVKDLRNYTLHRNLPDLGHTVSMTNVNTPQATMMSELELGVPDLLEWDGWTAPSRKYLESSAPSLQLRPVVKRHGDSMLRLNAWLHHELAKANESALEEVNELIIDQNTLLSGGDRDAGRRKSGWLNVDPKGRA